MEELLMNLVLALKQVKEENPNSKAEKILQNAVKQAKNIKHRWNTNWHLIN
tara:strand:+ start:1305 stop:1457 length:153 start_codon:yes stop_codon:yes gene_type:complete